MPDFKFTVDEHENLECWGYYFGPPGEDQKHDSRYTLQISISGDDLAVHFFVWPSVFLMCVGNCRRAGFPFDEVAIAAGKNVITGTVWSEVFHKFLTWVVRGLRLSFDLPLIVGILVQWAIFHWMLCSGWALYLIQVV